jgi:hypothetical protein
MDILYVYHKALEKGYQPIGFHFTAAPKPDMHELFELTQIQLWLWNTHVILVQPAWESLGSDEWAFGFSVMWLPKEFHDVKRRTPHFTEKSSITFSGGATYSGAWDTQLEALYHGLEWVFNNDLI